MNDTISKFGYPDSAVAEYDNWVVMFREKQITAGCLILAAKGSATSFSELSREALIELSIVTADIEASLKSLMNVEKINYVVLMMVDPHFHFHIIPRHSAPRTLGGISLRDAGWPRHPDFGAVNELSPGDLDQVRDAVLRGWQRSLDIR